MNTIPDITMETLTSMQSIAKKIKLFAATEYLTRIREREREEHLG